MREYWVYILGSRTGTLYVGVTNDLDRRLFEHRRGLLPGFASRYGISFSAIAREKQIKGWSRAKKIRLIEATNPSWRDLSRW
jgi:putative endonuclease